MQRGSFQWMKSLNKSIILNKIRKAGSISRAQIAKETELTPPTVGTIVKELLVQGLIRESQLGISQGGRKPTMLVLNVQAFHIVGVDVGPSQIRFIISDLSGERRDELREIIRDKVDSENLLDRLKKGIQQLMERHDSLQFIGIGVAMHGIVDAEQGRAIFAPNLDLRDVPIKERLEAYFAMTVKVENDAKALALGESWFHGEITGRSMVAINVGRGIGAGMVIDGKLYNGEHGIAGEIGHMMIDLRGKKCSCGNHGCLQTIASGPAIAERAEELLAAGNASMLLEHADEITAETIHQAAVAGDDLAGAVLHEAGIYLGIALTNLIHTFNPGSVIIGGGVAKAGAYILDPVRETIQSRVIYDRAQDTVVQLSKLGEYGSSLGAVALVLSELFQPEVGN
ncbi:ROK family transcriptional regulator [Gracilibacillus phocaeensis]|uniref:ROK family transcriptional regulator n=1 Tax=Gracilibacillus phocaeensis TaxID=2042304 RepID=UPI001030E4D9|nr:ROK family transcriptional regulator [Gracilibacillus phocaeensis]